MFFELFID